MDDVASQDWVISPDGKNWWDGSAWRQVTPPPPGASLSQDGRSWWSGRHWEPVPAGHVPPTAAAPPPAYPTPPPKPRGLATGGLVALTVLIGVFALPFVWYSQKISKKGKWWWTGIAGGWIVVWLVIIAVIGASGTGGVNTNAVEQFVRSNLASSVKSAADAPSDETVHVQTVGCVQATGSTWNCSVTYHVSAQAENISQDYSAAVNVTCDSTGRCSYPGFTAIPTH